MSKVELTGELLSIGHVANEPIDNTFGGVKPVAQRARVGKRMRAAVITHQLYCPLQFAQSAEQLIGFGYRAAEVCFAVQNEQWGRDFGDVGQG